MDREPLNHRAAEDNWVLWLTDAFLLSYASIFFSRSKAVGAMLLLATAASPRLCLFGVAGVIISIAVPRIMGLSPDLVRAGLFGYNALLISLGGAAFLEPGLGSDGLVLFGCALSVPITASFHAIVGRTFGLPVLTLPFLSVFYLLLGASSVLGLPMAQELKAPFCSVELWGPLDKYLTSLGSVFFQPGFAAGAVMFLAMLYFSRIGFALSLLGYGVAWFFSEAAGETSTGVLGYNCMLTAVAVGGVFYVPSRSSLALALFSSCMCALMGLGLGPYFSALGLPLFITPFNLAVFFTLCAMGQRVRDRWPKYVDFVPGDPEENLSYYNTRIARFGSRFYVRFHAPFMGKWVCTQAENGEHTHKGPWRHAFDFEIHDRDGKPFRGTGDRPEDFLCYRLPVLAPADGTVAKVLDGIPDNRIGEVNLDDNWGNAVVICHGVGLYSVLAHLLPRSIKVHEGQFIRCGDTVGLCGNSGRSPRPHLHFQLQTSARLGAPTIASEFHDVVCENGESAVLHGTFTPEEGSVMRNVEPKKETAALLAMEPGTPVRFETEDGGRTEEVFTEVDIYGRYVMRSTRHRTTLYYDQDQHFFTVFDTIGSDRSVLFLIHAALGRVPFEDSERIVWTDHFPYRRFIPRVLRPVLDLLLPFMSRTGTAVKYRFARDGSTLCVVGESERKRKGESIIRTRAEFKSGVGLIALKVTVHDRSWSVARRRRVALQMFPLTVLF